MIKKILCIFLLLFAPFTINAQNTEVVNFESTIRVDKTRTAKVDESISIYLVDKVESFTRILDKDITIYRSDNSKLYNGAIISNIKSDKLNKIESTSKKENVKLNLSGKKDSIKKLNLKYNYNLGKDKSNKYDEFYYNIISNLDSVSSNISFEFIFPEDVSIKDVEFAIDGDYDLSNDDITYMIEENVVTGYLNIMLNEGQTLSARIVLPNKYFVNASDNFNYLSYLYLIFPTIMFIVILIYWIKYASGNKVKRKFSHIPPNDFDPVEIGYLYKGLTEETDLITDLLYLANQGYLKIEENEDGYKLGKENSFKFIKLKEYEENNAVQKLLFEGIFKNKDVVELKDIEYNYNSKIIDVKKMIDNKNNRVKLFNIDINKVKIISIILIAISVVLANINPIIQLTDKPILVPLAAFIMLCGLSIIFIFNGKGTFKYVIGLILFGGVLYIDGSTVFGQTQMFIIFIIEIVLIILSCILYSKLPIRTKYGNKVLGNIEGFKLALLNMNKKQLEEILTENPNYFYEMVPYAYTLGILTEWMSKGKNLINERPLWHISVEEFDILKETRFFKNVIFTTSKVMIKAIYAKKESAQLEFKRDEINSRLNDNN